MKYYHIVLRTISIQGVFGTSTVGGMSLGKCVNKLVWYCQFGDLSYIFGSRQDCKRMKKCQKYPHPPPKKKKKNSSKCSLVEILAVKESKVGPTWCHVGSSRTINSPHFIFNFKTIGNEIHCINIKYIWMK